MLDRALRPIRSKINQLIQRGIVHQVDDSRPIQSLQVAFDSEDVQDNVLRVQNYGFTSCPPNKSESVVLSPCGERDYAMAISVDSPDDRLTGLKEGEVAIYNNANVKILLKSNGKLHISNNGQNLGKLISELIDSIQKFTITVPPSNSPTIVSGPKLDSVKAQFEKLLDVGDA